MDKKLNLPPMNAFFVEDPDEPGTMAIPVLVINGEKVMLNNIRDDRLDFFRPIVANISKEIGAKAYFVKYEKPSFIEEIEPVDNPNMTSIVMECNNKPRKASEIIEKLVDMVDEILVKRNSSNEENKPDEDTVH